MLLELPPVLQSPRLVARHPMGQRTCSSSKHGFWQGSVGGSCVSGAGAS
jgi:hypothetical protein